MAETFENLGYFYVEVENDTGLCISVFSSSNPNEAGPTSGGTTIMSIPVYDDEYFLKYYIDGNWYEDAEGTIPWTSSLL